MKRTYYSILATAILAVMVAACGGGGSGSGGSSGGKKSAKITMTTEEGGKFEFYLTGSGVATVNWGDGSEKISRTLDNNNEWGVNFRHDYPNANIRTITINGENITGLQIGIHHDIITSIDVSRCSELTRLEINFSKLTSLNISKNTALTYLNVEANQLTSLDVSRNTALTSLSVGGQLTTAALNALFRSLHRNAGEKRIYIGGNPGERDCDRSIAESKGWTFR